MNVNEIFTKYLQDLAKKYQFTENCEMGYRREFENLLGEIFSEIKVKRIDHDAKAYKGNKPDYIIYRDVPILYTIACCTVYCEIC